MRKFALGLTLLTILGAASENLEARHRRPARSCEIVHPAYYYRSYGQRRHGRYAAGHYRRYHRAPRYYTPRRRHRRDHYGPRYRGRFQFHPGRGYRHHRRHHHRPHFAFHLEF